jgi:IS5 family transposase
MHQSCRCKQWYFGMKVHIGVASENGWIHSVETMVYADAGFQKIEKRSEMRGRGISLPVEMRPGKRRALPNTLGRRVDDLIETALAAGFCLQ